MSRVLGLTPGGHSAIWAVAANSGAGNFQLWRQYRGVIARHGTVPADRLEENANPGR
jgi:hypothetical protein